MLSLKDPVWEHFQTAINTKDKKAWMGLLNVPQAPEWIKKGKSEFFADREYEYNEIELLEGIFSLICFDWKVNFRPPIIVQDKGFFAVTTNLTLGIQVWEGDYHLPYEGIATVYAQSIRHLTLATPKSVTDAIKNAAKRMGPLTGRNLNRGIEDIQVIQTDTSNPAVDEEFEQAKMGIESFATPEEAMEWLTSSPWKYNLELKKLINTKFNIQ